MDMKYFSPALLPLSIFLAITLPQTYGQHPEVPFMKDLVLVDEIDCSKEDHGFATNGTTEVISILGRQCRILKPSGTSTYFYYRIGKDVALEAGKAYFLEVEYPDDTDRNFVVQNRGGEYTRGIQTGRTIGDLHQPPYVQSNPESVSLPHTMQYTKWQTLFWLHDQYAGLILPRGTDGSRAERPSDGFLVIVCQFDKKNNPFSQGAAVSAIRLYEAPDFATLRLDLRFPPGDLPRRHLFFREEMADGVVDKNPPAVSNPIDFYEHEAQLMHFLGMNTFSKDLLEFGHNQGWDPGPYGIRINTPAWKDRWEKILVMLGNYELDVLPYYEYAGTIGPQGLGPQQRAHPLNETLPDYDYTHISWTENVNADITDPDTYDDLRIVLERTITMHSDKVDFVGAWLRPRSSQNPVSFSDATLNRFRMETGNPVTRAQLKTDKALYDRYLAWWFGRRKEFLQAMRDYLREEGVNDQAVILYTTDYSEPGKTHYDWGYSHNVLTDNQAAWTGLPYSYPLFDLDEYIGKEWHLEAQLLPENTWGDWEWQHAAPVPDPDNYITEEGVLLTYTFNKAYTVGSKSAFDRFRTPSGLAIIRHYCLNEDGAAGMGYFVADMEWHGPYTLLAEARAVANGDPYFIGYLAGAAFNRASVPYVREFNANFLALPALPSTLLEEAASDPEVAVRKIETVGSGTYLAVVNTGLGDKLSVTVSLEGSYDVEEAATGRIILADVSAIVLDMYPAQLKSFILRPPTGKFPQTLDIDEVTVKKAGDVPFTVHATASSGGAITWRLLSGPATLSGDTVAITGAGWINLEATQPGDSQYYPVSGRVTVRVDPASNVGVRQSAGEVSMQVYPNPVSDGLFIDIPNPGEIMLYDTLGNSLLGMNLYHSQMLDLSSLSPGVYFLVFKGKESMVTQKIIKQRRLL
jgi:hypothetical protein